MFNYDQFIGNQKFFQIFKSLLLLNPKLNYILLAHQMIEAALEEKIADDILIVFHRITATIERQNGNWWLHFSDDYNNDQTDLCLIYPVELIHHILDYCDTQTIILSVSMCLQKNWMILWKTYNRFTLNYNSNSNFDFNLVFSSYPIGKELLHWLSLMDIEHIIKINIFYSPSFLDSSRCQWRRAANNFSVK